MEVFPRLIGEVPAPPRYNICTIRILDGLTRSAPNHMVQLTMSYYRVLSLLIIALFVAGCAPLPVVKQPKGVLPATKKVGTYHKVAKGETLWRISKDNRIDLETLVEANGLPDAGNIEVGQLIFIPARTAQLTPDREPPPVYSKEDFIWPVKGRVTSSFGERKGSISNKGIDIRAREGTIIVASRTGRVIFSEQKVKGFGKTVILDHGDNIQTVYSHNSEILVNIGEEVKQAQPIAKVGSAGRGNSPYLHFEIRKRHKPQNPFYYLP